VPPEEKSAGVNFIQDGTRGKKKPLQSQRLNKTLNPGASEITSVTVVEDLTSPKH
jgi:hypothetical protein